MWLRFGDIGDRLDRFEGNRAMHKPVLAMLLMTVAGEATAMAPEAIGAQTQAPAARTLDRRDPNMMRCIRQLPIGMLSRRVKLCRTNAEWRAIEFQQSRDADDLITRSAL